MDSNTNVKIKCVGNEEMVFEITLEEGELSDLIRNTTEDREGEEIEIPIERVKPACLAKVVEFLKHHKQETMREIPTPLDFPTFNEVMHQEWYQNFVSEENLDRELLFELMAAANYFGIHPLLQLILLKITFELNGKNEQQVHDYLGLTPLEVAESATMQT